MSQKVKRWLKKAAQFCLNPRLLLCFGIGWMITNGWSYILFGFGTYFGIGWMIAVSGAYLTYLWLPISPEKVVTLALAIVFLRWLFPGDQKTLAVLIDMKNRLKTAVKRRKEKKENDPAE